MEDEKSAPAGKEMVCEFFGIQITTSNPNMARLLTASVNEILRLDVKDIKGFIVNPPDKQDEE